LIEVRSQLKILCSELLIKFFLFPLSSIIVRRELFLGDLPPGVESAAGRRVAVDEGGSFMGGLIRGAPVVGGR
jgi:hypothetical protein